MSETCKHRSPLAAYILLWVTVGFYWPYWLYKMMTEINEASPQEVFEVRRIFRWGSACLVAYLVNWCILSFFVLDASPTFPIALIIAGLALGLGWIAGFVYIHLRLARALNALASKIDKGYQASPRITVALFFCYFGVVPYLQSRWNRIQASRPHPKIA